MRDTSCKDCVFAVYDGKTQNGCYRNLIEKYRLQKANIIEAYDDDKEFYVLDKKVCLFYRTQQWVEQVETQLNDKVEAAHKVKLSTPELSEYARKEVTLSYESIIYVDENSSLKDVLDSCEAMSIQSLRPKMIAVLFSKKAKVSPADFRHWAAAHLTVKWRIQLIIEDNTSLLRDYNLGIRAAKYGNYTAIMPAGYAFACNYFERLDCELYDLMERHIVIDLGENTYVTLTRPTQMFGLEDLLKDEGETCEK